LDETQLMGVPANRFRRTVKLEWRDLVWCEVTTHP